MHPAEHLLLDRERLGQRLLRLLELVFELQRAAKDDQGRRVVIVVGAVPEAVDLERPPIEALGVGVVPALVLNRAKVDEIFGDRRMWSPNCCR